MIGLLKAASARRKRSAWTLMLAAIAMVGAGCGASINDYLLVAKKGNDVRDWGQVRDALVGIGTGLHQRQVAGFRFNEGELSAVSFLRTSARDHRDPASRMVAISMLAKLETADDNVDVFLETLADPHFGVRWESSEALVIHAVPRASEALAIRVEEETRKEVLINVVKALARIGDQVSVRTLIEILLDNSGKFRGNRLKAYEGLLASIEPKPEISLEDRSAWQEYYDRRFGDASDSAGAEEDR